MPHTFCVADRDRVDSIVNRMARQIHAKMPAEFTMIGIRRRGVPLVEQIAEHLQQDYGRSIAIGEVTVKRYADDLTLLHKQPQLDHSRSISPEQLRDRTILLVDDVLFSGRSLLRVLNWFCKAEAAEVQIAVLCARDTQEIPLCAEFVGMRLDVGPSGIIHVHAPPYEEDWAVWLSQSTQS